MGYMEHNQPILTGLLERILVQHLHERSLIRERRYEPVIYDDDAVVLLVRLDNQIGDTSRVGECRNISANLIESEGHVLWDSARELCFRLISDDHHW